MQHTYPDPSDTPWALLARHLAAEATAGERAALRAWVQTDPFHLQVLTTVTRAWERAGEGAAAPVLFSPADVEAAWQRFRLLLAPAPAQAVIPAQTVPPTVVRSLWPAARWPVTPWQLAAGLALLAGAGYWLVEKAGRSPETVATYASADRRQRVRLPDGSTVWLNAHSRVHYRGFGGRGPAGPRAVQLSGEAYFDVVHDAARPFVVSTATARVRVTGTAFNVRAYAAEDSVEVSVSRGRVWLVSLATPDSVLLAAGSRAAHRAADAPGRVPLMLHPSATADANFRAWQTDTLRFRDAPVAQVVQALRATFGTAVRVASVGLGKCRFTGTFAHARPAQVLAVLAAATGSRVWAESQGHFRLEGAGCEASAAALPDSTAQAFAPRP